MDLIFITIGWIIFMTVLWGTYYFDDQSGFNARFPTFAGIPYLFMAYFMPWVNFNPHEYFLEIDPFQVSEVGVMALEYFLDFPGEWFIVPFIEKIFLLIGPNAFILGLIISNQSLVLRLILLFIVPLLFACSLFRMLAEMISGKLWRRLAIAQLISAVIVLLLLLWKLPEIDGVGLPEGIRAGLLTLMLAPKLAAGFWVTIQGILLLIIGALLETLYKSNASPPSTEPPTRRSMRR